MMIIPVSSNPVTVTQNGPQHIINLIGISTCVTVNHPNTNGNSQQPCHFSPPSSMPVSFFLITLENGYFTPLPSTLAPIHARTLKPIPIQHLKPGTPILINANLQPWPGAPLNNCVIATTTAICSFLSSITTVPNSINISTLISLLSTLETSSYQNYLTFLHELKHIHSIKNKNGCAQIKASVASMPYIQRILARIGLLSFAIMPDTLIITNMPMPDHLKVASVRPLLKDEATVTRTGAKMIDYNTLIVTENPETKEE